MIFLLIYYYFPYVCYLPIPCASLSVPLLSLAIDDDRAVRPDLNSSRDANIDSVESVLFGYKSFIDESTVFPHPLVYQ